MTILKEVTVFGIAIAVFINPWTFDISNYYVTQNMEDISHFEYEISL